MRIWEGLESIDTPLEASTVAIGMFDGVHIGHQALIAAAVEDGRVHRRPSVVFTFDRHPAEQIAPDRFPGYLTTPEQRRRLIAALGPDHLVIARFDERFRQLSPEGFLRFVLVGILGAEAVFVGEDFRFGCNQAGDVAYLREAQARWDFALEVIPPVLVNGEKASSTRTRTLLRAGDIPGVEAILGHPYRLVGTVIEGERLGRRLGYPTANLRLSIPQVVPSDGIYAVWVEIPSALARSATQDGRRRYKGACSIGMRPTVGGTTRTIEVYLLDFSGDLYGETLEMEFVARLRDELKFDSLEALVEQMRRDVSQVERMLA